MAFIKHWGWESIRKALLCLTEAVQVGIFKRMIRRWFVYLPLFCCLLFPSSLFAQQGVLRNEEEEIPSPLSSEEAPSETVTELSQEELPEDQSAPSEDAAQLEADATDEASPLALEEDEKLELKEEEQPTISDTEEDPDPVSEPEEEPEDNIYKDYFKKGTIRIGASTDFIGSVEKFNETNRQTESISLDLFFGYFVWDDIELELGFGYGYTYASFPGGDQTTNHFFMSLGPGYYFNFGEVIVPYIRGRMGWQQREIDTDITLSGPISRKSKGPVVQGETGFLVLISPSWTIDISAVAERVFEDFDQDRFTAAIGFSFYWR